MFTGLDRLVVRKNKRAWLFTDVGDTWDVREVSAEEADRLEDDIAQREITKGKKNEPCCDQFQLDPA